MIIVMDVLIKSLFILLLVSVSVGRRNRHGSTTCREIKARFHSEVSDVVFTGTVRQVYSTGGGDMYSSAVLVKRVLKGDSRLMDDTVTIEGFGDDSICDTDVRSRDTWIFSAFPLSTKYLRLNASLQKVTLNNLERMTALVKDEPYRRRPVIIEEPCETKYCPYNGDCYVERRSKKARCRCRTACPNDKHEPVCGNDGVTYPSECRMRVESCAKKKLIFVRHVGQCTRSSGSSSASYRSGQRYLPRFEL